MINKTTAQISAVPVIELTQNTAVIKPGGAWFDLNFAEIWAFRELLFFLAWRDVKVRYKQTFLGVVWVLLQPIVTSAIFAALFARFAPTGDDSKTPYFLFAFSGFVLWTFVSNAVNQAGNSLVNHTNLITKVYFPRLIMPLAAIAATLLDLAITLAVLLLALLIFGSDFSWRIIFAPVFIILLLPFVAGLGILLAAVNVRFRDVKFVLPFALQVLMFATPIFYSIDFLPANYRVLWRLNPLTGIFENFRAAIFNTEFDFFGLIISLVITALLIIGGLLIFRRMEDDFADLI